mmetsp:Transcript_48514/g.143374  ORF Transcript_48514/g.143374 Transcript_48514/m.143374 type:complete len:327 (-) Transcript_48514:1012-1992(-)
MRTLNATHKPSSSAPHRSRRVKMLSVDRTSHHRTPQAPCACVRVAALRCVPAANSVVLLSSTTPKASTSEDTDNRMLRCCNRPPKRGPARGRSAAPTISDDARLPRTRLAPCNGAPLHTARGQSVGRCSRPVREQPRTFKHEALPPVVLLLLLSVIRLAPRERDRGRTRIDPAEGLAVGLDARGELVVHDVVGADHQEVRVALRLALDLVAVLAHPLELHLALRPRRAALVALVVPPLLGQHVRDVLLRGRLGGPRLREALDHRVLPPQGGARELARSVGLPVQGGPSVAVRAPAECESRRIASHGASPSHGAVRAPAGVPPRARR